MIRWMILDLPFIAEVDKKGFMLHSIVQEQSKRCLKSVLPFALVICRESYAQLSGASAFSSTLGDYIVLHSAGREVKSSGKFLRNKYCCKWILGLVHVTLASDY